MSIFAAGTWAAISAGTALLSAGGSAYMQHAGAVSADKAQAQQTLAELAKQRALREQGSEMVKRNMKEQGADGTEGKMDEAMAARQQAAQSAITQSQVGAIPGLGPDTNAAGPRAVTDAYGRELQHSKAYLDQQAASKAALSSFGDAQLGSALQNAQTGYMITNLNGDMAGSLGAHELELGAAGHAGDMSKTLGQALGAASQVAGSYAGMKSSQAARRPAAGGSY